MSADTESSLLSELGVPGSGDLLPAFRQSRGFLEPEQEPAPAPVVPLPADPAEPEQEEEPAAVAALPSPADGAATCAERLEMLGMLLASPCPSATITAPPDRLQLPLPADGFMCDQCGDRFVLPSSLAEHQRRRSMRVTLNCPACQALVVFSNKCQLLEHLDAHKIDPVSIDPGLIDAAALTPAELGLFPPPPPPPPPALGVKPGRGAVKTTGINRVERPVRVSCPMCNQLCCTVTLAEHMCPPSEADGGPLPAPPPRCPDCDQPCPTECSMMAHQGLHKPDLWPYPYVCPECGVKVLGSHDEALQHVVAGCLHMTRDVKICCTLCAEELGDAREHMLQAHVQKLYKCRRCPLAFESTHGFNSHLAEKHGGVIIAGEAPFMLILKCPFCAATFNNANALKEHMGSKKHGERVLQQVSFIFRCPECELSFAAKSDLAKHLTKQHPEFRPVSMILPLRAAEPPPPPPPPLPLPPSRGNMGRPKMPSEGGPRSRAPIFYHCHVCGEDFKRKADFTEHARAHVREGVPLCLLCNTKFQTQQNLRNHLANHASEEGRDRCGLCYAKLNTPQSLLYHLEGEHGMRTFDCPRCNVSFERLTDLNRHNFSEHRSGRGRRSNARSSIAKMEHAGGISSPLPVTTRRPMSIDYDADLGDAHTTLPAAKRARAAAQAVTLAEPALHLHLDEEEEVSGETLEEIASFVSGGGRPAQFVVEEETPLGPEGEEVIELELTAGEITAKQPAAVPQEAPADESAEYIMPDLDGAGAPHTPPEMRDVKPNIAAVQEGMEVVETGGLFQ